MYWSNNVGGVGLIYAIIPLHLPTGSIFAIHNTENSFLSFNSYFKVLAWFQNGLDVLVVFLPGL